MAGQNRDEPSVRKLLSSTPLLTALWIVGPIILIFFGPLAYVEAKYGSEGVRYALYGLGALIIAAFILFRVVKGHWPLQRPWKDEFET